MSNSIKPITVVIPTANRPEYLRTALEEVESIIVSENLGNRRSKDICHEFDHLPIQYVFRDPQLTNEGHIHDIFLEANTDFIALLCDDDWWTPGHLQSAVTALRRKPNASAFFAAIVFIGSEAAITDLNIWRDPMFPFVLQKDDFTKIWELNINDTIAASWLVTPFAFTTMVARREALHSAANYMIGSHPFYADRILYPELSAHGPILYDPVPDTFARWHSGNWAKDKMPEELEHAFRVGTTKIREFGLTRGCDPSLVWPQLMQKLQESEVRDHLVWQLNYALDHNDMIQFGFKDFIRQPECQGQYVQPAPIRRILRRAITYAQRLVK